MEKYLGLNKCRLFQGQDINHYLNNHYHYVQHYEQNTYLFHHKDQVEVVGIVMEGTILIQKEDYWGNRLIITEIKPGGIFLETYALIQKELLVDVYAKEKCSILYVPIKELLNSSLKDNLISLVAQKNYLLNQKIGYLNIRSVKQRLLSYLSDCAYLQQTNKIEISYNRQQLADYLGCDRSNLSAMLSDLKKQGYLDYYKNKFNLKPKTKEY